MILKIYEYLDGEDSSELEQIPKDEIPDNYQEIDELSNINVLIRFNENKFQKYNFDLKVWDDIKVVKNFN